METVLKEARGSTTELGLMLKFHESYKILLILKTKKIGILSPWTICTRWTEETTMPERVGQSRLLTLTVLLIFLAANQNSQNDISYLLLMCLRYNS